MASAYLSSILAFTPILGHLGNVDLLERRRYSVERRQYLMPPHDW